MILHRLVPAVVLMALAAGAAPGATPAAAMAERRCDVQANVADMDPAGLNVRATPGGAVIGALKANGDWVRLHVTGQSGGWLRIDLATLYQDNGPVDEKTIFRGHGYVAVNKVGVETLNPGAILRATASDSGRVVFKGPMDEETAPKPTVLGCDGAFLQLRVGGVTGWTKDFCTNQRTTCS
jgi:hypothetical protein